MLFFVRYIQCMRKQIIRIAMDGEENKIDA